MGCLRAGGGGFGGLFSSFVVFFLFTGLSMLSSFLSVVFRVTCLRGVGWWTGTGSTLGGMCRGDCCTITGTTLLLFGFGVTVSSAVCVDDVVVLVVLMKTGLGVCNSHKRIVKVGQSTSGAHCFNGVMYFISLRVYDYDLCPEDNFNSLISV